ncbi:hypothetical protein K4H28_03950 [Deefgea tanakiae]|uniref:Uncharacterized protein n=1 Tax=Deefgea tanakiae TaxID=2865840 RepID=A0ABX8Z7M1_9NEIS|nr:hypothetical protein [Deefgea tanakiae]QZA78579.1 hypothetical protein K4H28_03950 [Deefgea tanakiae]
MISQGIYISDETLRYSAYILLCQLLASKPFEELAYYPDCDDVVNSLMSIGDNEMKKNIMLLAALSRTNDDIRDCLKQHDIDHPDGVGLLEVAGKDKVLNAREACNKIIHNETATLEFSSQDEHPLYAKAFRENGIAKSKEYLVPFLIVTGRKQGDKGAEWSARINLIQWIFALSEFGH